MTHYNLALGTTSAPSTTASVLGPATLVADNDLIDPGRVYTLRTWSKVPLDPESRMPPTDVQRASAVGWVVPFVPVSTSAVSGDGAWQVVERNGWRAGPPRGHADFWQKRTPEASPYGWQGYQTSLNITATTQGVKASALRWVGQRVLAFMGAGGDVSKIAAGHLYARGVREESAGLLTRASEAIAGRDATRRASALATEMGDAVGAAVTGTPQEEADRAQAHQTRVILGWAGMGVMALLGVFLATRRGSAKVEGKLARGAGMAGRGAAGMAGAAAKGAALLSNRRRARHGSRRHNGGERYFVIIAGGSSKGFASYGDAQRAAWDGLRHGASAAVIKHKVDDGTYRPMERWTKGPSGFVWKGMGGR